MRVTKVTSIKLVVWYFSRIINMPQFIYVAVKKRDVFVQANIPAIILSSISSGVIGRAECLEWGEDADVPTVNPGSRYV